MHLPYPQSHVGHKQKNCQIPASVLAFYSRQKPLQFMLLQVDGLTVFFGLGFLDSRCRVCSQQLKLHQCLEQAIDGSMLAVTGSITDPPFTNRG
ncbi:hypothetical protein D3C75_1089150 [compost metagenome]